jgi:hypothetical protein
MISPIKPVLFFYGPSGVGKTYLAEWASINRDFIHLNFDRRDVSGVDFENLREEWDEYLVNGYPELLFNEINVRVLTAEKDGAIVSLPSGLVPKLSDALEYQKKGIFTVILYGPKKLIIDAYLKREATTTEKYDLNHWICNNTSYSELGESKLAPFRVQVFSNGNRIDPEKLMVTIQSQNGY